MGPRYTVSLMGKDDCCVERVHMPRLLFNLSSTILVLRSVVNPYVIAFSATGLQCQDEQEGTSASYGNCYSKCCRGYCGVREFG